MKIKAMYSVALIAIAMVLMLSSVPGEASKVDDRIESSAKNSYVFQTYLKGDDINIKSQNGVVSLTGTVSEESHKSLAAETVAVLHGVKSVDNQLVVKGEAPAEKSDAWLTTKVKTTLLFHRNVSAMTEVDTKDGIVTLRGDATSLAQKDLTTEYAKDVEGVKDVKNEMTVSKTSKKMGRTTGEKIDDASITSQVKIALLFHRSTSALSTKVETKNGTVTLRGKAGNAAEKKLAGKIANDIKGVKSVKNLMTIGESK
jgi:hyperosmotically inducible periplasmic protein